MKYKNIKSVAHNFAHSFTSGLNHGTMDGLAREAVRRDGVELQADLRSGAVQPSDPGLLPLRRSLAWYGLRLPHLLRSQRVDPESIERATMTLRFGPPGRWIVPRIGACEAVAFECVVEMTDHRGVHHAGRVEDVWITRILDPRATGPGRE